MSKESISEKVPLFFDDESIESIVYGHPSNGPSSASAFVKEEVVLDEAEQLFCSGKRVHAFSLIESLLRGEFPLSLKACVIITRYLRELVPDVPRPHIPAELIDCGSLLHDIIALATRYDATRLQSAAHFIAYRWHEARGEYSKARTLIAMLRDHSSKIVDRRSFASLTNNYGYEYLLEGKHSDAQHYFFEALTVFEEIGEREEVANARANWLTSRFALTSSTDWEQMFSTLVDTHTILLNAGDWRVRKTLRLYAERAAADDNLEIAIEWARQAAGASAGIATQIHKEDEMYCLQLNHRLHRRH